MARGQKQRVGYARLLDAWAPPVDGLEPIGCLATTFTFSASFFEEECLARFLRLEADPVEDGVYHLVEREEKLAQVMCAGVLVDQHHCRGARSLRWDMLPARLPRGILHAKVSLLCWTGWTRLIVASANLTEDGYRRNQEAFAALDFHADGHVPTSCLSETIAFLRGVASYCGPSGAGECPALQRWHGLLDHVEATSATAEGGSPGPAGVTVSPVLVGPGRPDVFSQLNDLWPDRRPPGDAQIVSPFFDPPEARSQPAQLIWEHLRKRGQCTVTYCVSGELTPDGAVAIQAPQSLLNAQPASGRSLHTRFRVIASREDGAEPSAPALRPLHAKCLWLEGDRYALYMVGSSNYTRAGLGMSGVNIEANLAFISDKLRAPRAYRALLEAFPQSAVPAGELCFQADDEGDSDVAGDEVCLPCAFAAATYDRSATDHGVLHLALSGDPPSRWQVATADGELLLTEAQWQRNGAHAEVVIPWRHSRPPSGLWVQWAGATAAAWWPVNVFGSQSLAPPDELRELPLDILLSVLTSALPLHRALRRATRAGREVSAACEAVTDPHRRVDTSEFLLQRSRRVSWALHSLRERLEKPVPNRQCLEWRLHGPIGVMAVANALVREAHSNDETAFLLSELALEIHRVEPREQPGCLPPSDVRFALRELLVDVGAMVPRAGGGKCSDMAKYVSAAWREVSR